MPQKDAVLIVDDDLGMRETARVILSGRFQLDSVETAEEALACLERHPYHVVLTDIRMSGMNGLELLKAIKERWPSTAVIVVSVINDVSVACEAMRLGAFFFLTKDFDFDSLNEMVSLAITGTTDLASQEMHRLREENMRLRLEHDSYEDTTIEAPRVMHAH